MRELLRFPLRASAFLGKEIFEILRQPRLVLTLVLGPFLILLLVGLGFRNEPRMFRTLFVVHDSQVMARQVEEYVATFNTQFIFAGVTDNEAEARERLRRGEVELVVVAPSNAETTIRQNQQATFKVYHNEIDPLQASYVQFVGEFYVEQLNRYVLRSVTEQSQSEASTVQDDLSLARTAATALREALERGDSAAARENQRLLMDQLGNLDRSVGASAGVLAGVAQTAGTSSGSVQASEAEAILTSLGAAQQSAQSLADIPADCGSCAASVQTARNTEVELDNLQKLLTDFENIDPAVLVSPFNSEASSIAPLEPRMTDFFAPAVLALLLQHLSITFAALSIVRERRLGTFDLFRVSPLSTGEALFGKYLSYLLFGSLLTAALTGLIIYLLGVPMLGQWLHFSLVAVALIFASLGVGFIISLVAQTDSQAVQYAMLVLLASVFFSGLVVNLNLLWTPVRVISWLLPVTYGMTLMQGIMLRGIPASPLLLTGLVSIGLLMCVIAWMRMKRLMARQ